MYSSYSKRNPVTVTTYLKLKSKLYPHLQSKEKPELLTQVQNLTNMERLDYTPPHTHTQSGVKQAWVEVVVCNGA